MADTNMDDNRDRSETVPLITEHGEISPGNNRSWLAKISTWILAPLTATLMFFASPLNLLVVAVAFVNTVIFLIYWSTSYPPSTRTPFSTLASTYLLTGTVGTAIVVVVSTIVAYLLALLILGNLTEDYLTEASKQPHQITDPAHTAKRAAMAARWRYWVYMAFFAFLGPAIEEELLKYAALILGRKWFAGPVMPEHDYLFVIFAAALGFSTIENVGYMYAAVASGERKWKLALTMVERVVLSLPMHGCGALLIGINVLRRDVRGEHLNIAQVMGLPVLFHGLFDLMLLAISARDGHLAWKHPEKTSSLCLAAVGVAVVIGSYVAVTAAQMAGYAPYT